VVDGLRGGLRERHRCGRRCLADQAHPIRHLAWAGFLAPAGTPRAIVDRLNAEIVKALRAPDMEQLLRDQGSRVVTNSPDEFAAFIRKEQEELAALVKATGAKLD
jgi:tripartite-type tricarboxylate transporter receptor subunit TctC